MAVADAFDVHNRSHVEKAQRVEMRLVDLDVLPVIAPDLLNLHRHPTCQVHSSKTEGLVDDYLQVQDR